MAGQDGNKTNGEDNKTKGDLENDEVPVEPEQNTAANFTEEYDFLDTKLDELNSALDSLENKNDDIQKRLKELLQSNRTIREQLQNERNMQVDADK